MEPFNSTPHPPDGWRELRIQDGVFDRVWRRLVFWCIAILVFAVTLPFCRSQVSSTETKLKAAYLFNFARYTEWPVAALPESDSPITIAILGDDPFGEILD